MVMTLEATFVSKKTKTKVGAGRAAAPPPSAAPPSASVSPFLHSPRARSSSPKPVSPVHASLQAAALARIAGKPDIFKAVNTGDVQLVREHFAADPSCIHRRGEKYAIWPLKDSLLHACATSISFIFVPSHWTPLFWASVNGNDELCGLLVSFTADVNAKTKCTMPFFFFGMPSKWPTFCHQATNPAALFFWYWPF